MPYACWNYYVLPNSMLLNLKYIPFLTLYFSFSCFHNDTKNMFLNLVLNKLIRADDLLSTNDMSMVVVCTKFDFLILIYFFIIIIIFCTFVYIFCIVVSVVGLLPTTIRLLFSNIQ